MILNTKFVLPLTLALLTGVSVACSSDSSTEDEAGGSGDGDMTQGDGDDEEDQAGAGGATDADGERMNTECSALEGVDDSVCVNTVDCEPIASGEMRETAKTCLLEQCIGKDGEPECVAACMVEILGTSTECSTCYGASGSCSAANCLMECFADGDAPECVQCQAEAGCTGQFVECSGLDLSE